MIKPYRLLALLLYLASMIGLVMLMSPGELTFFGDYTLKIPTWNDAFGKPQPKADIAHIIALEERIDSLQAQSPTALADSLPADSAVVYKETPDPSIGKKSRYPIEYPDGQPGALDQFFGKLVSLSSKDELLRILHYGDSQLEGDRVSDYLRNRFQKRFGGCGVGLAPITEIDNIRSSLYQETSENWIRYAAYGPERKQPKHKNYSLLGSYYSFDNHEGRDRAWVSYFRTKNSYMRFKVVENVKVLLRSNRDETAVSASYNGMPLGNVVVAPAPDLAILEWPVIDQNFRSLRVDFSSLGSPDVYGVALDCNRGIALDNIAMRGSSALEFTQINRSFFKEQVEQLNTRFMILQFGVNVVPKVLDDYKWYENAIHHQLKYLKSLAPDIDILVVGLSDMSRKKGTSYETYPNVELIRNAQKNAAFRAGCAFWDLYKAMGGKNSMISWVQADPPLAATDFTHFTRRGAQLVAEMLYNEIMVEYEDYKKREFAP